MNKLLTVLILAAAAFSVSVPVANATMTCDPIQAVVCTGDSIHDPYASCDGIWADAWALGLSYAQVCTGYDGVTHVYVCPGGGEWQSPTCQHVAI